MRSPFARPDPATYKREIKQGLDRAFGAAPEQELELGTARLIVFSDHHKGARDGADDFQRCERAYNAALAYYLASGHRLVALGDVEELWECAPAEVIGSYPQTLGLEAEFHKAGRYDRFFGNHDDLWGEPRQVSKRLGNLFPHLSVREALKLRVTSQGSTVGLLFLAHGHQGTRDSDRFSGVSRLFVRHVWRPLQRKLRMASTTPAVDWELRGAHDTAMFEWARDHGDRPVLIAGHTHRPVFGSSKPELETDRKSSEIEPELLEREAAGAGQGELARLRAELEWARAEERRVRNQTPGSVSPPCYFNTGCCSFGDGDITGLEIADGAIRLVRWPDRDGKPTPLTLASEPLTDVFGAVADGV